MRTALRIACITDHCQLTLARHSPTCCRCDVDNLANPDNIHYLKGTGKLLVGEDTTTGHQNDVAWLYDVKTGERTLSHHQMRAPATHASSMHACE